MKSKVFAFLAILLILVTSISVVGCDPPQPAAFQLSDLTMSPGSNVDVGTAVTISVKVTNTGGTSGNYTVACTAGGSSIGNQSVELAAKASQTVSFTYTPSTAGSSPVTVGSLSGTIKADPVGGYWEVKYNVVNGSRITLNYSLGGIGGVRKEVNILPGQSTVTMRVNKSITNGYRDIALVSGGWKLPLIYVEKVSPGVNMNIDIILKEDAIGKLYVQAGVGDVDASSLSSRTTIPKQQNTYGDGTKDPAGSLLVETLLQGNAHTSVGVDIPLPFKLTFTTGHSTNLVSIPSSKFNKATLTSDGVAFAKTGTLKTADGKIPPDYVGTAGTITTTGTGDCLGLTLVGFPIDFQAEIKLVLEPESIK